MPGLQFFLDYSELGRILNINKLERNTRAVRPFVTEVQILGDAAKAFLIVEEFIFHEEGRLPGRSLTSYEIDFVRTDGNWFILEIRSDNYMERNCIDKNERLDVEGISKQILLERLEAEQRAREIEAAQQELPGNQVEDEQKLAE